MSLRNLDKVRPSIALNFKRSKKLDPRVTFTRASYSPASNPSSGTGTSGGQLQQFNVNVPRLTDQGLFIEQNSTNRQTHSQNGSQWTLTNGTSKDDDQPGAPDSSSTAIKVYSVYTGELTPPSISGVNASGPFVVEYDLAANPPTTTKSAPGLGGYNDDHHYCGVEVLANGWYRIWQGYKDTFSYSVYVKPDGATTFKISFDTNQATLYVDGSSTTGGYFWGGQFEDLDFPTSYVPTTTAAVTRAADLCQITGTDISSWFNLSEGTAVVEFHLNGSGENSTIYLARATGATSAVGVFASVRNGGNQISVQNRFVGERDNLTMATGQSMFRQNVKVASGYNLDGIQASTNVDIDTHATDAVSADTEYPEEYIFGCTTGVNGDPDDRFLNGYFQSFTYYSTRVTDLTLQALTY